MIQSIRSIGDNLAVIAEVSQKSHPDAQLKISQEMVVEVTERRLIPWIPFPLDTCLEDATTIHVLGKIFGKKRLQRLFSKAFNEQLTKVCVSDLEKLFVYAAAVTYEDITELFSEIIQNEAPLRFLSQEGFQELYHEVKDCKTVDELSTAQISLLLSLLIPFNTIEDIFLHRIPRTLFALSAGKSFSDMRERVALCEDIRRVPLSKDNWVQTIAKKLTNYEMPIGTVITNKKGGFHRLFRIIHGGGAYKFCFVPVGTQDDMSRYIVYRGTSLLPQSTDGFLTLRDDFREKIGEEGVRQTEEETKKLLIDPSDGFVSSVDDKKVFIGMSLGGVHASRDFVKFSQYGSKNRLVTVSSPGIDRASCERFAQQVTGHPTISHVLCVDDDIDQFGECKLGLGIGSEKAKIHVTVICPSHIQVRNIHDISMKKISLLPRLLFLFDMAFHFLYSIVWSHNRVTKDNDGSYRLSFSNQDSIEELQKILSNDVCDVRWEETRLQISYVAERVEQVFYQIKHLCALFEAVMR